MKKILMATDLSARSDRALDRAIGLVRDFDAELTIVHVVDEDLPALLADAQQKAAQQAIQEHVDALRAANGPSISIEVVFGRAYSDILETAEIVDAEMIVLGVHRENAFKDMFRGTTAERVIRASNVPVLLVKNRAGGPYQRIMVAVDFSVYSRRAVQFAISFVPSAEFYLVHAYGVPFQGFLYGRPTRREVSEQQRLEFEQMIEAEMAAFLASQEAKAPKFERIIQEGEVRGVIHREVCRLKPDLLVIGTHGRTGVAHAFVGSVAEDMLREPPCDVMAVKAW